jgi:DNA polymerase-3 subunit epsilon
VLPVQRSLDDLGTPLCDVTFVVLDLETTGSDRSSDLITEIGAVKVRGGEVLGTFHSLVNPGRAIPPTITVLTGLTDHLVATAPRIETVLPSLLEFLGDAVVVGHNVGFDLAFLGAALRRSGRAPLAHRHLDTLPLARRLVRDEVPDCRLGTLAHRFALPHRPTHRALDDAWATTDLLHVLIERAAGFGVLGLDDLAALPTLGGHPQAAKLRLTEHLPRSTGIYCFHGADDRVLYVGKATNLRQRVRSYFGGDDRRKVGTLLREARRISHLGTPSLLVAEVLELRALAAWRPRYNKVGLTTDRYRYVQFDVGEAWPRLTVTATPRPGTITLGPLSSTAQARLVVEAVHQAIPLRCCPGRLPANIQPAPDRPMCAAARLGAASCPCSGGIDAAAYAALVQRAVAALTRAPATVIEPLQQRMVELATARRFEEAAGVRDRLQAFVAAVRRQRAAAQLRNAGTATFVLDGACLTLCDGVLQQVALPGELPLPLPLPPPTMPAAHLPVPRDAIDEVLVIARHLDRVAHRAALVSCTGTWTMPSQPVRDITRLQVA